MSLGTCWCSDDRELAQLGRRISREDDGRKRDDGELSAGFQSDLTVDEDAVDGLLTAEEFAAEFDENLRRWPSCTPSIVGSPRNKRPCADWPRWSRGGSNHQRYSTQ